jgi:hypothetical protein
MRVRGVNARSPERPDRRDLGNAGDTIADRVVAFGGGEKVR